MSENPPETVELITTVDNPELVSIPGVAKWAACRTVEGVITATIAKVYLVRLPAAAEEIIVGDQRARVETVSTTKDASFSTITARIL